MARYQYRLCYKSLGTARKILEDKQVPLRAKNAQAAREEAERCISKILSSNDKPDDEKVLLFWLEKYRPIPLSVVDDIEVTTGDPKGVHIHPSPDLKLIKERFRPRKTVHVIVEEETPAPLAES